MKNEFEAKVNLDAALSLISNLQNDKLNQSELINYQRNEITNLKKRIKELEFIKDRYENRVSEEANLLISDMVSEYNYLFEN